MELGLRDKVALVAAASRGLGRAIAEALATEGASVIICSRNAEDLEVAKRAIESRTGGTVDAIAADLSDRAQIDRLAKEAIAKRGRVDVLVTNAGGPPSGAFEAHDWDAWQRAVDLTLRSAVELTRAFLPGMRERKWGRIINVTSITVKQPVDNLILSNSIRAAVTGFARTLANEVATDGITVNNILPGYTRTERVEELADATAKREGLTRRDVVARFESQIPMRRLGEPEEFAALATFLASSQASYITGQSIAVDGGWIKSLV
jgi:3-oxoacyl-[acyl-carrier protein] reductase